MEVLMKGAEREADEESHAPLSTPQRRKIPVKEFFDSFRRIIALISPAPATRRVRGRNNHSYRQSRKNCAPPEAGTVICQLVLPTKTGTLVKVTQVPGLFRLELA